MMALNSLSQQKRGKTKKFFFFNFFVNCWQMLTIRYFCTHLPSWLVVNIERNVKELLKVVVKYSFKLTLITVKLC